MAARKDIDVAAARTRASGACPMTPDPAPAARGEEVGECWLVWGLTSQSKVVLLAVDLSPAVAERHRRHALAPMNTYVRVYVEPAKTNHLYGETIFNERSPSRAGAAERIEAPDA